MLHHHSSISKSLELKSNHTYMHQWHLEIASSAYVDNMDEKLSVSLQPGRPINLRNMC